MKILQSVVPRVVLITHFASASNQTPPGCTRRVIRELEEMKRRRRDYMRNELIKTLESLAAVAAMVAVQESRLPVLPSPLPPHQTTVGASRYLWV